MREFFGKGNNPELARDEINEKIRSTTPAYKPVAVLSTHGVLRIHDDRLPNSTRAFNELENIIARYSLVANE